MTISGAVTVAHNGALFHRTVFHQSSITKAFSVSFPGEGSRTRVHLDLEIGTLSPAEEGLRWIRGHVPFDSPEAHALLATAHHQQRKGDSMSKVDEIKAVVSDAIDSAVKNERERIAMWLRSEASLAEHPKRQGPAVSEKTKPALDVLRVAADDIEKGQHEDGLLKFAPTGLRKRLLDTK